MLTTANSKNSKNFIMDINLLNFIESNPFSKKNHEDYEKVFWKENNFKVIYNFVHHEAQPPPPFLHAIKESFLASKVDSGHCFYIT